MTNSAIQAQQNLVQAENFLSASLKILGDAEKLNETNAAAHRKHGTTIGRLGHAIFKGGMVDSAKSHNLEQEASKMLDMGLGSIKSATQGFSPVDQVIHPETLKNAQYAFSYLLSHQGQMDYNEEEKLIQEAKSHTGVLKQAVESASAWLRQHPEVTGQGGLAPPTPPPIMPIAPLERPQAVGKEDKRFSKASRELQAAQSDLSKVMGVLAQGSTLTAGIPGTDVAMNQGNGAAAACSAHIAAAGALVPNLPIKHSAHIEQLKTFFLSYITSPPGNKATVLANAPAMMEIAQILKSEVDEAIIYVQG